MNHKRFIRFNNFLDRLLDIARQLGSPRFEAQALMYEGKLDRAEGRPDEAIKTLESALEMSGEVGHGFAGPRIVGEMARNLVETEAKRAALAQGERMLEAGSVSHNHFFFYPDAIEVSFDICDWDGAERYAAALEDFTRFEPLPWCNFFNHPRAGVGGVAAGPTGAAFDVRDSAPVPRGRARQHRDRVARP